MIAMKLTAHEIGHIYSRLETVVSYRLIGEEKNGTIAVSTGLLNHSRELTENCGLMTLSFSFISDRYTDDNRRCVRVMLAYLQRMIDDNSLVLKLNTIQGKRNMEMPCTEYEKCIYNDFKTLVNKRIDLMEEKIKQLEDILNISRKSDPLLAYKIASIYDIEYVPPKSASLAAFVKAALFGSRPG